MNRKSPWIWCDSYGQIEGSLKPIGVSAFWNNYEYRKYENRNILPYKFFGSVIDDPIFGLDRLELLYKHIKSIKI